MAALNPPLPAKKDVARALLLRGSVFIHLDPRKAGVVVPAWLRNQPQVVLQVGLDMPVPIPDLRVDEQGVFGTLSFQRSPFTCVVPWDAVFALVGDDAKGMVWPPDMPREVADEVDRQEKRRQQLDLSFRGESLKGEGLRADAFRDGKDMGDVRDVQPGLPGQHTPIGWPSGDGADGGEVVSLFEYRASVPPKRRSTVPPAPKRRSERPSTRPPYLRVVK